MGEYVWFHDVSWHATYAVYFFVIGISAGVFFFSCLSWYVDAFRPLREKAAYVSFALTVLGGLLLIGDLSQPLRFLNMLNPAYWNFTSPLVWGMLILAAFGLVSVGYIMMLRKGDEKMGRTLATVGAVIALGLPIYTGFDLAVHQSRPIWNTPIMPVLFVAMAIVSGAAVASFLAGGSEATLKMLRLYMVWSAGAVGVCLISILGTTAYGGSASELTFTLLTSGSLGLIFVGIGIIAGTAAPIALMLAPVGRQPMGLMLSALLILAGGAALRYALLMGPQYVQTLY